MTDLLLPLSPKWRGEIIKQNLENERRKKKEKDPVVQVEKKAVCLGGIY